MAAQTAQSPPPLSGNGHNFATKQQQPNNKQIHAYISCQ